MRADRGGCHRCMLDSSSLQQGSCADWMSGHARVAAKPGMTADSASACVLAMPSSENRLLKARAVYGIWPAERVGDDIRVPGATFHTLRQQQETNTKQNLALADFVAPAGDFIGGFAVTAGIGVEELVAHFQKDHDDYNSIMTKIGRAHV